MTRTVLEFVGIVALFGVSVFVLSEQIAELIENAKWRYSARRARYGEGSAWGSSGGIRKGRGEEPAASELPPSATVVSIADRHVRRAERR